MRATGTARAARYGHLLTACHLSFRLIAINTTTVDVEAAELFVDAAAKVGIELKFSALDTNTLGSIVYNAAAPNWDIFVWGWDMLPDPDL